MMLGRTSYYADDGDYVMDEDPGFEQPSNQSTSFAGPENLNNAVEYLNRELALNGLPSPLQFVGANENQAADIMNAMFMLLQQRQRESAYRSDLESNFRRVESDYDTMVAKLVPKLQSQLKEVNDRLKVTADELKRTKSSFLKSKAQFDHEKRKWERELKQAKDKMLKLTNDRLRDAKIYFTVANPTAFRGKRLGEKDEFYAQVLHATEQRERELLAEVDHLKQSLYDLWRELQHMHASVVPGDSPPPVLNMPFELVRETVEQRVYEALQALRNEWDDHAESVAAAHNLAVESSANSSQDMGPALKRRLRTGCTTNDIGRGGVDNTSDIQSSSELVHASTRARWAAAGASAAVCCGCSGRFRARTPLPAYGSAGVGYGASPTPSRTQARTSFGRDVTRRNSRLSTGSFASLMNALQGNGGTGGSSVGGMASAGPSSRAPSVVMSEPGGAMMSQVEEVTEEIDDDVTNDMRSSVSGGDRYSVHDDDPADDAADRRVPASAEGSIIYETPQSYRSVPHDATWFGADVSQIPAADGTDAQAPGHRPWSTPGLVDTPPSHHLHLPPPPGKQAKISPTVAPRNPPRSLSRSSSVLSAPASGSWARAVYGTPTNVSSGPARPHLGNARASNCSRPRPGSESSAGSSMQSAACHRGRDGTVRRRVGTQRRAGRV
ncbi:hypothetical protein AMAG_19335 [Allomyces macrogynus ATCC 38327]|uniref:Uncharacterized protein n=1 Tax=Allomyces macrogynus (strain ATCC 38327) TaxID=578462 RepID=A0A0L0SU47_ALLM3|nr:hypothetical protein AMAG_19335 [Allomyces macrogynus ATCC 38327]|eukprot:KNE66083.1 hypothetical protein AMAG_19335 [Allomyces macrogynus ATCC 38327]